MRFVCTIYNRDYTFGGKNNGTGPDESGDPGVEGVSVVASSVMVTARNQREAAARAYIRHVGRPRARFLREQLDAPRRLIAQETNPAAIAASLRKLRGALGEGYEMDNFVQGWFITVHRAPMGTRASHRAPQECTWVHDDQGTRASDQVPANPLSDRLLSSELPKPCRQPSRSHLRRLRVPHPLLFRLLHSHSPN
jgi:hypothetical protein